VNLSLGCCCGDPPPPPDLCTGCLGQDLRGNSPTIGVDLTGLTWPLSTNDTCTDTYNFGFYSDTWNWETLTKSLSSVGAGITLQMRPPAEPSGWPTGLYPMRIGTMEDAFAEDMCVWYWEDSEGINDRVRLSGGPEHSVINTYTPTNPDDAASYWYRLPQVYSGSSCTGWTCGHRIYGNAVTLQFVAGPSSGSTWNNTSGPSLWWLLSVFGTVAYRFNRTTTQFPAGGPGALGYGGQSVGGVSVNPSGPCCEVWNAATGTYYQFGRILNYAKRVECESDFNGSPITLNVDPHQKERADAIGVSYPSTCLLTL